MKTIFNDLKLSFLPRFWDKKNKCMIYPTYNSEYTFEYLNFNMVSNFDFYNYPFNVLLTDDNFIKMLPVGVKDKNEVILYQCDIIEYEDFEECDEMGNIIYEPKNSEIVFETNNYSGNYFTFDGHCDEMGIRFSFKKVCKVGNTYENLELIPVKNESV